jgi:two-component system chemotaxis sensor kinase CheA
MKRKSARRPDARLAELRTAFGVELGERTAALAALLPRLDSSAEALGTALREAHSLKGAARAAELPDVERLAHAVEAALAEGRDGGTGMSEQRAGAMRRAIELIGPLARVGLEQGEGGPEGWAGILEELAGGAASGAIPGPEAPLTSKAAVPQEFPLTPEALLTSEAVPTPAASTANAAQTVRVSVAKLDALLAQAGELAVAHIRIEQRLDELLALRGELDAWRREWRGTREPRAALQAGGERGAGRELERTLRFMERAEQQAQAVLQRVDAVAGRLGRDRAQLGLVARAIEDEVLAARLLPVETVVGPFERLVRDLGRQVGKEVRLVVEGGATEIDRKILELLRDPLMHMLRNAVDHGIEPADERQAGGKPRDGTIRLAARQRGDLVEIELEDDGAGLDPAALRRAAVRKGLLNAEQAAALDDQAARELIFEPGFSTRQTVGETSGRGVGMDVVREHVERLNGRVEVASQPGRGTRFALGVPLTVATTRAILVEQTGQVFAIPSAMVERSARVRAADVVSLEGRRAVPIGGQPIPAVELAEALDLAGPGADATGWRPFIVLRQRDQRLALLVEQLVGEQEIVVKSLGWPLRRARNVGGAALLGSGQTVVILNPADLLKSGLKLANGGTRPAAAAAPAAGERRKPKVLVVDDSVMTRTLERSILDAAGYATVVAADGLEALDLLRAETIDLVVSDVEMPRLDGFGLTAEVRRDEKLRHLPVVLVTSLGSPEHRERGVTAGADAYIVKSQFDQSQLLDAIGRRL